MGQKRWEAILTKQFNVTQIYKFYKNLQYLNTIYINLNYACQVD